jgi:5-methylcytosine-specific restriction enzyme A
MPRAPKPCGRPGCGYLVRGTTYCPDHSSGWKASLRTASSKRTSTQAWKVQRAKALQRDAHMCVVRGPRCLGRADQVDHVISVANGGTDDLPNLASTCKPCHDEKTQREAREGRGQWKRTPGQHPGLL